MYNVHHWLNGGKERSHLIFGRIILFAVSTLSTEIIWRSRKVHIWWNDTILISVWHWHDPHLSKSLISGSWLCSPEICLLNWTVLKGMSKSAHQSLKKGSLKKSSLTTVETDWAIFALLTSPSQTSLPPRLFVRTFPAPGTGAVREGGGRREAVRYNSDRPGSPLCPTYVLCCVYTLHTAAAHTTAVILYL